MAEKKNDRQKERIIDPADAVRRGTKRPGAEEQPAAEAVSSRESDVTDTASNVGDSNSIPVRMTPQKKGK